MAKRFEYRDITPAEFSAALDRACMKPNTFARLFGVDRRTVIRWVGGSADIPSWVGIVLQLVATSGGAHGWLRKAAADFIIRDNAHPERGEFPYRRFTADD